LEKRIFSYLSEHPKDSARALHLILQEEVSMLHAAFQSHLWNQVLRSVLKLRLKEPEEIKGREGSYLFWRNIDDDAFSYLCSLEIPTPAVKMDFSDGLTRSLYDEILKEESLQHGSFRTKALRKVYFRSFRRRAMIIPDDLRIVDRGGDEYPGAKKKMTISFFLPRGTYGTMLVKRISLRFRDNHD
jgi:tRNA pseudouridine13 synthase